MKSKRFLCSFFAVLMVLNLTACKNIDKNEQLEEEKGIEIENFIDMEEFNKFRKEVSESISDKVGSLTELISDVASDIREEVSERIDGLEEKINSKFDSKIEELEGQITDNDSKIDELEQKVDELEQEVDSLKQEQSTTDTKEVIELNNVAYVKVDSVLYDSKGNEIGYIDAYQKVLRLGSYPDGTDLVEWDNGSEVYIAYMYTGNLVDLPTLFVEVDLSSQTVNLVRDGNIEYTNSIVSGHPKTPTRIGYFNIDSREKNRYLSGPGYKVWVNYWMPFDGGIGLHDADGWRTGKEYGGETYINDGSHGCVNMPNEAAKYLYENLKTGNMVLVHK